ncbi:hypothetical protein V6N12_030871 [Hibiscus sabdariffa]|uniref:Uncharacterized protein n=1 Tax=Hibiscus sabdariffa TaxID=183260 RepID=A0ABR2E994_9ROSI
MQLVSHPAVVDQDVCMQFSSRACVVCMHATTRINSQQDFHGRNSMPLQAWSPLTTGDLISGMVPFTRYILDAFEEGSTDSKKSREEVL